MLPSDQTSYFYITRSTDNPIPVTKTEDDTYVAMARNCNTGYLNDNPMLYLEHGVNGCNRRDYIENNNYNNSSDNNNDDIKNNSLNAISKKNNFSSPISTVLISFEITQPTKPLDSW
ncbi:hypothetical protein HELRODRAFT_165879 [Helobdella robusta]|uniref:Uncharacterized protein n=1 Tax=Helobdella robusta TaxID=6412 RepID=T1EXE4_HELRO|nr:hypothetical protein HELRODRAFT_165879 [Helobdella robusta]ESN91799.1 hypothetical protein HELRODRAFT_165879 [Helobdella robusta]